MSNINYNFNKLTPFKFFCLTNFPFIEEDFDSLTTYELLCKVVEYLNRVIDSNNSIGTQTAELTDAFNTLKNYVDNYFNNLDVQDEINNKLDEMTQDGTLANIINNEIFSNLNKKINNKISSFLNYNRIGRIVDETFLVNKNANGYYGMQGLALIDNSTIAFITNHFNSNGYADENSLIRKVSIDTGNILQEKIIEIGHGNGFVYDKTENCFYIASGHGNINNESFSNKIIKLDNELNILNTITTDINFDSLSFDENGQLYAGVTYKGDTVNGLKIYKLDKENFSVLETIVLKMPVANTIGTGQDFAIFDNKIFYLQYNPNQIFVFDMKGNNIKNYEFLNNNFFNIGEVQNINSIGNGNFIIGSTLQYPGNLYAYEQIFEINVINNVAITNSKLNESNQNRKNYFSLNVDNTKNIFNPDGTTEKPFYTLEEIINMDINNIHPTTINLIGTSSYPISRINSFNGEITGSKATITSGDGYNNILIRDSKIYFNTLAGLYPLNLEINSDIKIYNSTLIPTDYEQLVYMLSNSTCELENCKFSVTEDLTNALFNNIHGKLIWSKNNQNPLTPSLSKITKWFIGIVDVLTPLILYSGSSGKGENIVLNNNFLTGIFKNLSLRFTDQTEIVIPCKNGSYYFTTSNLSKSGVGNNNIFSGLISISNGTITLTEINEIIFNSAGEMSVNISPDYKLLNVFAY